MSSIIKIIYSHIANSHIIPHLLTLSVAELIPDSVPGLEEKFVQPTFISLISLCVICGCSVCPWHLHYRVSLMGLFVCYYYCVLSFDRLCWYYCYCTRPFRSACQYYSLLLYYALIGSDITHYYCTTLWWLSSLYCLILNTGKTQC